MPRIVERGVLLWTKEQKDISPQPDIEERRGVPWLIAAALAILASVVLVPLAYENLWPEERQPATRRRPVVAPEEHVFDASDEEAEAAAAAGQVSEMAAGPSMGMDRSSATEESEAVSLPDPRAFFDELLQSVWDQTGTTPSGVRLGSTSQKLRETLVKAFQRRPAQVEVLHMPRAGDSGLCTLKVKDDAGREGIIGVRLVRLKGTDTPWEVESLVVMKPAPAPRAERAPR